MSTTNRRSKTPGDDSGLYVVWLELRRPGRIEVGALGAVDLSAGVYAYVGSAQRNRSSRIKRHMRTGKALRWHIDYIREQARALSAACVPGTKEDECRLAARLAADFAGVPHPPRFGASDCRCPGHLIYFGDPPPCLERTDLIHPEAEAF